MKRLFYLFAAAGLVLTGCGEDPAQTAEYKITVSAEAGGSAVASAEKAVEGAEITLTATPDADHEFVEWTATGVTLVDATANPVKFKMPAGEVSFKAEFREKDVTPESYNITVIVAVGIGGTASANVQTATAGTEITITATHDTGFEFVGWSSDDVVLTTAADVSPGKFIMPAKAVTITASFSALPPANYTVDVTATTGGVAEADIETATEGTDITITATPAGGYEFIKWNATGITLTNDKANPATFSMPAGNVSVEAQFDEIPFYNIAYDQQMTNGTITATVQGSVMTSVMRGATVTITANPAIGYEFVSFAAMGVTLPPPTDNQATFTMPDNDVVIGATFSKVEAPQSVVLGGVEWATRNLDAPGTFAQTPESFGMLYQWNIRTGWSMTGAGDEISGATSSPAGATWAAEAAAGSAWDAANDPCPEGWRVPTNADWTKLTAIGSTYSMTEPRGRTFTSGTASLFLPITDTRTEIGYRLAANTPHSYWSADVSAAIPGNASVFSFSWNGAPNVSMSTPKAGLPIRCVKKTTE